MEEIHETGAITHRGPVASVQVHAHMEFGPYALTVPLDTKIVIQLMFMLAEQTRQGPDAGLLRVTPLAVLERLRELGVRAGNGSALVGKNAVYDSFARLREKGYIRRITPRDEKGRPTGTAYEFYDWPSWNPDAPKGAEIADSALFPQVRTTSGNAGTGNAGSHVAQKGAKQKSVQVKSTSGNAGNPHTPGGGNYLLPQPPHGYHRPHVVAVTEGGGEAGYAEEDLQAAADVLELLPDPWTQGKLNASKLAPKLLGAMAVQGWPSIHTVDRALLTRQLTKNPHKITNPYRLLSSDRIPNLPRYAVVVTTPAAGSAAGGMCPKHPKYRAGSRCIPCAMAVPA